MRLINFFLCLWSTKPPSLLQPGLSSCSEVWARKLADELSWVIISIKDLVSFKHRYSDPLIASLPNNWQKGEGPNQLQASIFFDLWLVCYQMQWSEGEGPQLALSINIHQPFDSLATEHNRQKGGRASGQLQALIFSNPWLVCYQTQSSERGEPLVSFKRPALW